MIEFLLIFCIIFLGIDSYLRAPRYRGPRSDHFNGKHFFNITLGKRHLFTPKNNRFTGGFIFFLKRLDSKVWHPRLAPQPKAIPRPRIIGRELVVTFVNHSTVLIQTEGLNIITDPVWSTYTSPFPFLGPKRYMDPGVDLAELPPIDLLLLTHNHYDHMDLEALKVISKRDKPLVFTPLGNSRYLEMHGIGRTHDMDWGHSRRVDESVEVDCVPAQHFSARSVTDHNATLWGGFVIRTPHGDIYFAGDTGYGPSIGRIGKLYPGGFRLGFLPIGAYEPRSFMHAVHTSPEEAVQIAKELKVGETVPIHFGTFDLALDGQDDAVTDLHRALSQEENRGVKFTVLQNGQSCTIG